MVEPDKQPACVAMLRLAACLAFLASASALYFDESKMHHYDSAGVTVTHTKYRHRARRSADVMPEEIHVTVASRNVDVKLRLRRNALAALDIPMYTVHGRQTEEQRTANERVLNSDASGFYQDRTSGASMLVRRTDRFNRAFEMEGPMRINGSDFLLTPSHQLLPMDKGGRAHELKRLLTVINYGHDFKDERNPLDVQRRTLRALQRKARRQSTRTARQAPVTHTVEVTAVIDYKAFQKFMQFAQNKRQEALKELKLYYIFLTNLMDIRYRSVTTLDSSLVIRVALVSIVVADVQTEAVWTENNKLSTDTVHAERALYSFRDWLKANPQIPRADHWMLFSGYDLAEDRGTATIGIAFIGTMCTNSAVSVVEDYFTATSGAVSAHELGHSMDADHDGSYKECSDDDSHVMSTIATFPRAENLASRPWLFSTCSVDAFGAYLDTAECALQRPPKSISTKKVGGLYLNADEQCELAMGSGSYFCRTVQTRQGYGVMCRRMYCYLPNDPGFCSSIVPQEFTSCNNGKWCELGRCVANTDAPATIANCPQGDDKQRNCATADCSKRRIRKSFCCRTCAERRGITLPSAPSSVSSLPTQVTSGPAQFDDGITARSRAPSTTRTTTKTTPPATTTTPTTTRKARKRPKTTTTTSQTTTTTTTDGCQTIACHCQQHFSIFCFFYYRG